MQHFLSIVKAVVSTKYSLLSLFPAEFSKGKHTADFLKKAKEKKRKGQGKRICKTPRGIRTDGYLFLFAIVLMLQICTQRSSPQHEQKVCTQPLDQEH
jgi:hypothetical protein